MRTADLRPRSFAVRYVALFAGEAASKLCVLFAFAFLARILGPAEYGTVELAFAVTVFFVLGVESGLGAFGARITAAHPERLRELVPRVMLLRAWLAVPAYLGVVITAVFVEDALARVLIVTGAAVLLTPFLTQWVFQGLRQMHLVAAGTLLRNFTFAALVLLLVRPGSDIRLVGLAEITGLALLGLFNSVVLFGWLRFKPDVSDLLSGTRRLFGEVWTLGLSDFTWACLWYAPAILAGWVGGGTEDVAWVAAPVRIVLSLHTFVFLYFFNLLPNLAKELVAGADGWRDVIRRSVATSMWPAALIALGGTLIAPLLMPLVYGPAYEAAIRPFQIAIWMIPVAWFSGHFRFSLIAAGQQKREFAVSAATAAVTVACTLVLARYYAGSGATAAFLIGGIVNTCLAIAACNRYVHEFPALRGLGPVCLATALCLAIGLAASAAAGAVAGAVVGCAIFVVIALRQDNDLIALLKRRWTRT